MIDLTNSEIKQVNTVAHDLLNRLKAVRLVLDCRKRQQSRAAVRLTIEEALDALPAAYTKQLYDEKCDLTYQHIYDSYIGSGRSIYA